MVFGMLLAATVGVVYEITVGTTPQFHNPNFLDAILSSRLVMAAVRAVLFVSGYLVISVVALVSHGRWLSTVAL
jgi:hypothetical protein